MKTLFLTAAIGLLIGIGSNAPARAGNEGYTIILDKDHTDGWTHIGDGEMRIQDGIASTFTPKGATGGMYFYEKAAFTDFALKLEFKIDTETSNSGILVRFPNPGRDYEAAASKGYEIDIYGAKTGTIVSLPDKIRPSGIVPLHPGDWNECEVTAIGQNYTVRLNGHLVNEFAGRRALSGFIGLQNWKGEGDVHFRNVGIKELSPTPELASGIASNAGVKGEQNCIEILSEQAPNALEWALAPLDRTTPPDIRQNLTLLRENLLDEGAKYPVAGADAYKLGQQLCNELIGTLSERDKALVRAGYTAAQASANIAVTNQSLEARRNFQMRWPQYFRERDQRDELRKEKDNGAALTKQRPVVEWADRGGQIRKMVDGLYAQFREAARRTVPPGK